MREVFLGEYIRQRRLDLGLTQAQLCEGICEPMTISRLENGKQTPSRNHINALLERLGLPADRYFALLSTQEQEIDALQKEIVSCNVQFQNALEEAEKKEFQLRAYEKIRALEKVADADDRIIKQFILRSQVLLGKENGGQYSPDEKLDMLSAAIRLTVPRFDLENIGNCLYSLDEVKVINQIAGIYSNKGQPRKAVEILAQLFKYIQTHYQNVLQSAGHLPLVTYNYSLTLYQCKRYEEAIEIAELGRQSCIKFGHYQFLAGLLHIMALCHYRAENNIMSSQLFHQSYYLYQAMGDEQGVSVLQEDAKKYCNIEFIS